MAQFANWSLFVTGKGEEAQRLASSGEQILREIGERLRRATVIFTLGHVALVRGLDPTEMLGHASQIAADLGAEPESALAHAIGKLDRARRAIESDRPLVCGHAPEDITSGRFRWLRENRPEAIPTEVMARLNEDGKLRPERET